MINVVFKNLEKSELAKEAATERMESIVEKFPDLHSSQIKVTLEMQNSPHQAGPDFFVVKTQLNSGRYRGLRVEKSAQNLYVALAAVVEHMLELLNRFGDRARVKSRSSARKFATQLKVKAENA
jgi:ribosome-associated translation inhibitor RaiA